MPQSSLVVEDGKAVPIASVHRIRAPLARSVDSLPPRALWPQEGGVLRGTGGGHRRDLLLSLFRAAVQPFRRDDILRGVGDGR